MRADSDAQGGARRDNADGLPQPPGAGCADADHAAKHYREVYVWLQAVEDYACLRQMDARVTQNLHLIQPNLRDYTALLASGGIDYVGTRLHGGIHAMNMGCRSLILAVDNRASEIAKDTNLPVLPAAGIWMCWRSESVPHGRRKLICRPRQFGNGKSVPRDRCRESALIFV